MPNINSRKKWSEMDVFDLAGELEHGHSVKEIADFLCRDEDEVRKKMRELGLQEKAQEPNKDARKFFWSLCN
jgi:hypothetical protein